MSLYVEFCRYCGLLAEDVGSLSPYTMVTIIGYGKFDGYAPIFLEIREDVLQCARVYAAIDAETDLSDVFDPLSTQPSRALDERLLQHEIDRLVRCMEAILAAARGLGPTRFRMGWSQLPDDARAEFVERLRDAGLGETLTAEESNPTGRGDPIYVSPLLAKGLSQQIVPALRSAGLEPVAAGDAAGAALSGDGWSLARKRIAACRGGVMSVSESDADASEREIAEGLKHFPKRMIIVAEERLISQRPLKVDANLLFPVRGPTMSAQEARRFAAIVSSNL